MATDPSGPLNGIVVAEDAPPAASYAAEEFKHHYREASGDDLPINTVPSAGEGRVFVGSGALSFDSSPTLPVEDLGEEDLHIAVENGDVAVVGGGPRGTLYGVYTFLEDRLGVRFLAPDHTHVPDLGDRDVLQPMQHTYRPPLEFRYSYYGVVQHDPEFAARLRNNTVTDRPELGGRTPMRLINHSFERWVNTDDYGDDHPEYFALVDGERRNDVESDAYGTQPCMTEPAVRELILDGVLEDLEENPEWTNVSVSQNDNTHYCRCEDCRAIIDREGSAMGPLLELVNEVADVVAERHPDVMVGTLAYQYSRAPPETVEPRDNVQIQLCSIEACVLHPIDSPECERNTAFCDDLAAWGEITDRIYVWNYNTNFRNYLLPCPNLRVIEPNVRYFVENGANGLFMQAAGGANVAEFDTLRNYLISNLLWDPSRSADELREEFLRLHYRESADPIREWLDLIHDNAGERGLHNNCFGDAEDYGITPEIVEEGRRLFERALERAESDRVRRRVERASLCVHRAAMEPAMLAMRDRGPWNDALAEEMRPVVERFYELADEHDVNVPVEHTDLESEKRRMRELFGAGDEFP